MPHRPASHVVADRALVGVQRILADAGYTAERVAADYGEDLLVQTSRHGRMDASRMWFQVKGTQRVESLTGADGIIRARVRLDHALRWIRTADLVVFVLWDVTGGTGHYVVVKEQVSGWDAYRPTASITLRIPPTSVLDVESVEGLAWESRLQRYEALILVARANEAAPGVEPEHERLDAFIALDFLESLGTVHLTRDRTPKWGVTDAAKERFAKVMTRRVEKALELEETQDATTIVQEALLVFLLSEAEEVTGNGLRYPLLVRGAEVLGVLLGATRLVDVIHRARGESPRERDAQVDAVKVGVRASDESPSEAGAR